MNTTPSHELSIAERCLVLFVDLQSGTADFALTLPETQLRGHVRALSRLVKIFELPVVISTVPGPGGVRATIYPEISEELGDRPILQRTTPNAFNSENVRAAIEATGRKTLIVSGVATEVAVMLPALTAVAEGYDVHVLMDCCGGLGARSEDASLRRMTHAGVKISSLPSLVGELAGDFALPKGGAAIHILFPLTRGA